MDRSLELLRRCAIAMPLVRATTSRLTARFQLRAFDRDDLEQELWLELLIRWNRSGSACAERLPRFILLRRLKREIGEVAALLAHSSWLWHRLRPTCQSADRFVLECATDARLGHEPLRLHELRSDVAAVVSQLPAHLRQTCHRLMSATAPDELCDDANGRSADADTAALRDVFKSSDLHEYL